MKGTQKLKEILNIKIPDNMDSKNDMKEFSNEVAVSSTQRDEYGLSSQPKPNKK